MNTAVKWFLRLVYVVFFCVLASSAFAMYLIYQLLSPAGPQDLKVFTLKPGTSALDVSDQLQDRGLIRSAYAFRMMLRVTHNGNKLQAGDHSLSPSMNSVQIMEELLKVVTLPEVSLTVPEGLTLRSIAKRVQHDLKIPTRDFAAFTIYPHDTFPDKKYLPATSLEGYLFPDTYSFDPKVAAKDVVERMLKRYEEVVLALPEVREEKFPQHLTLQQMMTVASLVEAEAKVDEDRPLIAAVYYNRLTHHMRMECDATILYAMGERKTLSLADLKYESPYNTYLHDGLPPGPICSPGLSSIQAALHPKGDYLYYVRNDIKKDGSHVFARTFAEHQGNIRKYSK